MYGFGLWAFAAWSRGSFLAVGSMFDAAWRPDDLVLSVPSDFLTVLLRLPLGWFRVVSGLGLGFCVRVCIYIYICVCVCVCEKSRCLLLQVGGP